MQSTSLLGRRNRRQQRKDQGASSTLGGAQAAEDLERESCRGSPQAHAGPEGSSQVTAGSRRERGRHIQLPTPRGDHCPPPPAAEPALGAAAGVLSTPQGPQTPTPRSRQHLPMPRAPAPELGGSRQAPQPQRMLCDSQSSSAPRSAPNRWAEPPPGRCRPSHYPPPAPGGAGPRGQVGWRRARPGQRWWWRSRLLRKDGAGRGRRQGRGGAAVPMLSRAPGTGKPELQLTLHTPPPLCVTLSRPLNLLKLWLPHL